MLHNTDIAVNTAGYVAAPGPESEAQLSFRQDFAAAIASEQLSLHYQPIVTLETGTVEGFEALMRWTHPERGTISPGEFIPLAEETGLIVEASRWALSEACRALGRMKHKTGFKDDLYISVNFSSVDFEEENFIEQLYNVLSQTDTPPRLVHLEISQALLRDHLASARETLALCRKAGLKIAIDDFGRSERDPMALTDYPVDIVKIDRALISALADDETARTIVRRALELCKFNNVKTVAAGIEQAEEGDFVASYGCTAVQGYHYGKPLDEKNLIAFLQAR